MRITLVTPYAVHPLAREIGKARFGGVEVAVDRMARELARRGHDVTLLATSARPFERDEGGVLHVALPRRGTFLGTPLTTAFRRLPPADLVHVVGTYPGVTDVAVLAARRRELPVVLDYHFDGHAPGALGGLASRAYYSLASRALLSADLAVAKSRSYAAASPLLSRVPGSRLAVVPNGVDAAEFPLHRGARRGVVAVGRLVPYKGMDVLVRAAARLARVRDGVDVSIAGDGPLCRDLERLARRLRAPVRFLGRVPQERLPALYGRAAVTVLPSRNGQEAFGICLLESMATGTPVVASDLPGVRDVAEVGGVTSPPGDPAALATAIADVLDQPPAPPREIRARATEQYAWDKVTDRLLQAYAEAGASA